MKKLPQELLKLLACLTMLIDHLGAVFFPQVRILRILGRIAFPIYCFLLSEGIRHTHAPRRYLARLFVGMLLSELPFDYLFYGGLDYQHQSVMLTLLLGGFMLLCMQKVDAAPLKLLLVLPFALVAEAAMCDYGGMGIVLIALFGLLPRGPVQAAAVLLLCLATDVRYIAASLAYFPGWPTADAILQILSVQPPIQTLAVTAMVPICLYSGRKLTRSHVVQTAFYLFYPVHLAVLAVFANFLL